MNFRNTVRSILVLTAVILPLTPAFADEQFESFYTTPAENSTQRKDIFQWDEKPWVYVKFRDALVKNTGGSIDGRLWSWEDSKIGVTDADQIKFNLLSSSSVWFSLSDDKWNNIKRNGVWVIGSLASLSNQVDSGNVLFSGATSFRLDGAPQSNIINPPLNGEFQLNAAPEPISSILFLTGGLVMAGGLVRKRKRQLKF